MPSFPIIRFLNSPFYCSCKGMAFKRTEYIYFKVYPIRLAHSEPPHIRNTYTRCLIYRLGTNYCLHSFSALTCCVCCRYSMFKPVRLAPNPMRRPTLCNSERHRRVMYVVNRKTETSRHAEGRPLPAVQHVTLFTDCTQALFTFKMPAMWSHGTRLM